MRGASLHQMTKPCGSAHTVNDPVVQPRFMPLSGETSTTLHPDRASASGGAASGNRCGDGGGVSRWHSSPTPEVMLRTW